MEVLIIPTVASGVWGGRVQIRIQFFLHLPWDFLKSGYTDTDSWYFKSRHDIRCVENAKLASVDMWQMVPELLECYSTVCEGLVPGLKESLTITYDSTLEAASPKLKAAEKLLAICSNV